MEPKYYEDLPVGATFTGGSRTITNNDLASFLSLSGTKNPKFRDRKTAEGTEFGKIICPGVMTITLTMGLTDNVFGNEWQSVALLGFERVSFLKPVTPGDTISVELEVAAKRETKRPDRGHVLFKSLTRNQHGEVVLEMVRRMLYRRRPAEAAETA